MPFFLPFALLLTSLASSLQVSDENAAWTRFELLTPAGPMPFTARLAPSAESERPRVIIANGPERIDSGIFVSGVWDSLKSKARPSFTWIFDDPESSIGGDVGQFARLGGDMHDVIERGEWVKAPNRPGERRMQLRVKPAYGPDDRFDPIPLFEGKPAAEFAGRWRVKFSKSDDLAVGLFEVDDKDAATGTFLTTTGDYRYLAGRVDGPVLRLSVFDGAHAFLFRALMLEDGTIAGEFWSGDWWFETWTAVRDDDAQLPDAFTLTRIEDDQGLRHLPYPRLDGEGFASPLDPELIGDDAKVVLVQIFGSWCPNCHDAAEYLRELQSRYKDRGLRIVGLAFEREHNDAAHPDELLEIQRRAVRAYLERHDLDGGDAWPVLVAGLSDKAKASRVVPVIDRVRSFPTTLFVDSTGRIRHVHQGFTGPATGEAYDNLRAEWERRIESMLKE